MTKGVFAAIAFGGFLVGASAVASPPAAYKPVSAQLRAEKSCDKEGVWSNSAARELCLAHVTRAYEWGEPALAKQLAHVAREARESCQNEGFRVETAGFTDCIGREIDARSDLLILGDDQSGENVAAASK
jgi:hypothetical protein